MTKIISKNNQQDTLSISANVRPTKFTFIFKILQSITCKAKMDYLLTLSQQILHFDGNHASSRSQSFYFSFKHRHFTQKSALHLLDWHMCWSKLYIYKGF